MADERTGYMGRSVNTRLVLTGFPPKLKAHQRAMQSGITPDFKRCRPNSRDRFTFYGSPLLIPRMTDFRDLRIAIVGAGKLEPHPPLLPPIRPPTSEQGLRSRNASLFREYWTMLSLVPRQGWWAGNSIGFCEKGVQAYRWFYGDSCLTWALSAPVSRCRRDVNRVLDSTWLLGRDILEATNVQKARA